MKDVLELIPQAERTTFAKALLKQDEVDAKQLLSDLGYLGHDEYERGEIADVTLLAAVSAFRADCHRELQGLSHTNFTELYRQADVATKDMHVTSILSPSEVLLLKSLVGLEGEFVFYQMPEQLNVSWRVAAYRMQVYGLITFDKPIDFQAVTNYNLKYQGVLGQYKFDGTIADFLNVLGDQHQLSAFCKSSRFSQEGFIGPVFFFRSEKAREFNKVTGERIALNKRKNFLDNIEVTALRDTLDKVIKRGSRDSINLYISSQENRFVLRALQVKLWIFGLYQGKLDDDFGPLSLAALQEFLRLIFDENDGQEEDLKNILYVINGEQCLINFQYLLEHYIMKFEQDNEEGFGLSEYFSMIDGEYESFENVSVHDTAVDLGEQVQLAIVEHTRKLAGLQSPKRLYKGKNGFRKLIARMIAVAKSTFKRLAAFMKNLMRILSDSVKFIFEEIKEALMTFRRGLIFLFGKRIIKTDHQFLTNYDFDFDGVTYLKNIDNITGLKDHSQEITARAESLYPTIRFVTEVIAWGVKLAAGVGWVQILIGMSKLLKQSFASR